MPGTDQYCPGDADSEEHAVAIELLQGDIAGQEESLCDDTFVVNAVRDAEKQQALEAELSPHHQCSDDQDGNAVAERNEEEQVRWVQKGAERYVAGQYFCQQRRKYHQGEYLLPVFSGHRRWIVRMRT